MENMALLALMAYGGLAVFLVMVGMMIGTYITRRRCPFGPEVCQKCKQDNLRR